MKEEIKNGLYRWIIIVISTVLLVIAYIFLFNTRYLCDSLYILYKDDNNRSHILILKLTKSYNILPYFHNFKYNYISVGEGTKRSTQEYKFNSINDKFIPGGFVKRIKDDNNENTLRENYSFELNIDNDIYKMDMDNLNGDFLINNSEQRLTYINLGTSDLFINNKKYRADFALDKQFVSGSLKSKYMEKLVSKNINTFFSDLSGNLYYLDISDVYKTNTNYISHAWALYKNGSIMKKDVGKSVKFVSDNENAINLEIGGFNNSKIVLEKIIRLAGKKTEYSLLKGELKDNDGVKIITGFSDISNDLK